MPVYEYLCSSCHKHFEELQSIKAKPLKKCKFCQGKVQRLISQTAFTLKGGGWYKDGYAGAKGPSQEKPGAKSEAKPTAKAPKGPKSA